MKTYLSNIIDKKVITDTGFFIGSIKDIDFDVKSGIIKAVLIKPDEEENEGILFFKKKSSKAKYFEKFPKTSDNLIIIPAAAIRSVQQYVTVDTKILSKFM